jgi:hypothetical protein
MRTSRGEVWRGTISVQKQRSPAGERWAVRKVQQVKKLHHD